MKNNDRKGENAMFLGLSLTTWLILLGVFVIVTPIVGKQVAKDSLRIKDSLSAGEHRNYIPISLFPMEWMCQKDIKSSDPVRAWSEKIYIKQMMMGGVWLKFLENFANCALAFTTIIISFLIYVPTALYRGIFSTK